MKITFINKTITCALASALTASVSMATDWIGTGNGGNWHDTSMWEGGVIPNEAGAEANIILNTSTLRR